MKKNKIFFNQTFDKNRLKILILWVLTNYDETKTINFIEDLKDIGFFYATKAGLSISIDDLKIPPSKSNLIVESERLISKATFNNKSSKTTQVEYFQNIIDLWYRTSELVRYNVIQYFNKTDKLNPVFMMAFSGARGNISQVKQLVGMRGLMADPEGQILNFPIRSNFREGLSLTEYIISCYGARKGLVDTALKTANSGYLTRRLVDVAQHIIISQYDCQTTNGIYISATKNNNKIIFSLDKKLVGRVLAENILLIGKKNQIVTPELSLQLNKVKKKVLIRSPLTCNLKNTICQLCYGWSLSNNIVVSIGESVGILAAQSIGEPGTQLTMRTFHTGGVFSGDVMHEIRSEFTGIIQFKNPIMGNLVRTLHGQVAYLTKEKSYFSLENKKYGKLKDYNLPPSTILFVKEKENVKENRLLAEYSFFLNLKNKEIKTQYNLIASQSGEIYFENFLVLGNKNTNKLQISLNFGTFWILEGIIYESPLYADFFIGPGDLIDQNSIILQTNKIIPYSAHLSIKTNKKFIYLKPNYIKKKVKVNSNSFLFNLYPGHFEIKKLLYKNLGYLIIFTGIKGNFFITNNINDKNRNNYLYMKYCFLKKKQYNFFSSLFNSFLKNYYLYNIKNIYIFSEKNLENSIKKQSLSFNFKFCSKRKQNFCKLLVLKKINTSSKSVQNSFSLKKNPYKKITKQNYQNSVLFFKNSFKLRKNQVIDSEIKKDYGIKKLKNSIIKIKIEFKWFMVSSPQILWNLVSEKKINSLKLKKKFSELVNFNLEIENLLFKESYFSKNKFLLIRKKIKNSQFHNFYLKYSISRNRSFFKNIQLKNNCILSYKKIKPLKCENTVNKKIFLSKMFNKNDNIENFKIKEVVYNQQKKYKIQNTSSKVKMLKSNKTLLTNKKIISSNLYFKIKTEKNFNNGIFEFVFPQKIRFMRTENFVSHTIKNSKNKLQLNNNLIPENSKIFINSLFSPIKGEITKINQVSLKKQKILFLTKNQKRYFALKNKNFSLKIGRMVRFGDKILNQFYFNYMGQIIEVTQNKLTIRLGEPFLFSNQGIIHIKNSDLVKKDNLLMTLFYQKLKTEDIIQGIPKIEELFEARNTKLKEQKVENIHGKLELCFKKYKQKYSIEKALRKSIKTIQQILIHSIQKVYQDQGVFIADKHIEIIVRQMTTKVVISESGKTGLLQGELIDIKYIEEINYGNNYKTIMYKPVILGITKASLETDSFISAASFQETTRVLTNAALEKKTDFLYGLKENVILGHLIPAGTGYSTFTI